MSNIPKQVELKVPYQPILSLSTLIKLMSLGDQETKKKHSRIQSTAALSIIAILMNTR